MCGIAALFDPSGALRPVWARAMADMVRHRGPDGEGYAMFAGAELSVTPFAGPDTPRHFNASQYSYLPRHAQALPDASCSALLAHRRLAIVDLSAAGHQPMSYADGRYWIAYNGEVYNHIELRTELESLGHRFVSHSDTEVMLAAYAQWREGCLSRFNGMFAFVLLDRQERRIFAARDRFGIKPLYYRVSAGGQLAFASEIKQFSVLPEWRARLNHQRGYDFLVWGLSEHSDETLFNGVRQLRGGESVSLSLDDLRPAGHEAGLPVRAWYELKGAAFIGDLDAAATRFRELLTDAVRLRLRSDVPVGSCLSGGLDSSAIVCLMHDLLKEQGGSGGQQTFTAYSEGGGFDERPYAREVIAATGVDPYFVSPKLDELFSDLGRIAWHQDEPFSSTSIYAQWKVFELAGARHVKVMLDGQGADEALGGYPVFWGARLAGLWRGRCFGTLAAEIGALRTVQGRGHLASLRQMLSSLVPANWIDMARNAGGDRGAPPWLDFQRLRAQPGNPFHAPGQSVRSTVAALSLAQLTRINLPMLLHWEDRNSMAHSVEARVPFLDYRLVELALGLPDDYKLGQGWTKRILRESLRGVLPERIRLRRDKIGFETPELQWMRKQPEAFRAALMRAAELSRDMIAPAGVRALFDQIVTGRTPYSYLPWRLISFGAWVEKFAVDCGTD